MTSVWSHSIHPNGTWYAATERVLTMTLTDNHMGALLHLIEGAQRRSQAAAESGEHEFDLIAPSYAEPIEEIRAFLADKRKWHHRVYSQHEEHKPEWGPDR